VGVSKTSRQFGEIRKIAYRVTISEVPAFRKRSRKKGVEIHYRKGIFEHSAINGAWPGTGPKTQPEVRGSGVYHHQEASALGGVSGKPQETCTDRGGGNEQGGLWGKAYAVLTGAFYQENVKKREVKVLAREVC